MSRSRRVISDLASASVQPGCGTIIAIGASTGGVEALFSLLGALPARVAGVPE